MFNPFPPRTSRIGFHYYPDTLHYRDSDLQQWLPELTALGAAWLVVRSDTERAVPEFFLRALLEAGIEPLVQFELNPASPPSPAEIATLFEAYSRWGVHGVLLFNRPNTRSAWPKAGWAQQGLVERFLDNALPISNAALQAGLNPIFPPLEPGGSYWDTAFLRGTLETLERRKQNSLLENLVLSAYAWTHNHPLDWGAGGPGRWPSARPYSTPAGSQDQRGFRIFEWYQSIAQKMVGSSVPLILLGAGLTGSSQHPQAPEADAHARLTGQLAALLAGKTVAVDAHNPLPPVPNYVLSANFCQLAAAADDPGANLAWYQISGTLDNSIQGLKQLAISLRAETGAAARTFDPNHPIEHYLLVPNYEWGIADYHLDLIRPLIKRSRPTVGFSVAEARLAREVTVVGNATAFTDEQLDELRHAGCKVQRVFEESGINIAISR